MNEILLLLTMFKQFIELADDIGTFNARIASVTEKESRGFR